MTSDEVDYFNTVNTDKKTCDMCPTQWEGTLKDGRSFYFRFRWGYATLMVGDSPDTVRGHELVGEQISDDLDGYLDDREYRSVFMTLLREADKLNAG